MSLESVFAKTPPFVVGFHKKDSGMEDKERSDNDDAHSSDTEIHSGSDDGPPKLESQSSTLALNGMIAETPSNEDVAANEDLEDGELEEGEIDSDDDTVENDDNSFIKTEDIADPEPPKRSPEQLEKIPPLLLNLKNIVKHEPEEEEEAGGGSGTEGSPSAGSSNDEEQALAAHKKKKKKKKQKKKRKREREEKEMKKKKKKYVDHDQVEEYPAELDDPKSSWSGSSFHGPTEFFRSTSSKHRSSNAPDRSPPGPYDSPYDSPPGPYDSPSDDDEFGPPPKLQRYDGNEKGRYRANKKASMLSLLEDGYMDAEDEDEKELFEHESKHKKSEKSKYYRDLQKQRESRDQRDGGSRDGGAGKQQRPICKFYKEGKCAKGSTCQFSHDVRQQQQHRPEICKFYLNSVCSKGDSCHFMHGTFPCRFFHAVGGCIHGDNCRFSHEKLTEETRHILERVLMERMEEKANSNSLQDCSSSPRKKPSLLGSPPRQVKKIPSLFDIKVFPPGQSQRMKSPSQGSGPMSPPPRGGMGPGFYSDIRQSPNRMPPPIHPNMMMPPPGMMPPRGMMPPDVNRDGLLPHPGMYFNDEQQGAGSHSPYFGGMPGGDSDKSPNGTDDGASAGQTEEGESKYNIPVHLAPKQRELVLRIQQKQRERDASVTVPQNTNGEEAENDNWYSSDEEDTPKPSAVPPNLLQNLGLPPGGAPPQQATNQQPSALNIAQMLSVIRNSVTAQAPPTMGDGQLGGMNPGRDPRVMMTQPSSDPRSGPPHASPKTHDPRLHSSTGSNLTSSQHDASITVDASLAQSGGGVPYVVRRHPSIPSPSLPTSVNMFDTQHAHDPRVQKLVKKLEPSLIHQHIAKGDAGVKQRMIPLMGEHDVDVTKPAPALPLPQLSLPPLLQNMVLSGVLPPEALQQMVRFPPKLPPPRLPPPPQHRFQQPPPNILVAAAMATMSHVRLGRTMSQPPPCEASVDPRSHRRGSVPVRRDSNPVHPVPEKVIDPRVARLHEARSQDSPATSPTAAEIALIKALSAPVIPATLPQLLQIPPPPLHPGLKPAMTDPRTCKSQGGGSASSSDDQGDSPQHVTQHADVNRPLLSHRNDPRFKKRNKAVADTPAAPENNVTESEPVNPPPPQRRGMEYSSPLGGNVSEVPTDTSAGNAYNRPPNARFQQLQQHQKHHFKNATPNNGKTTTLQNMTASLGPPQLMPEVTDATIEHTPEQLQSLGAMGDEPSLKDMFKTFDPTASPFC